MKASFAEDEDAEAEEEADLKENYHQDKHGNFIENADDVMDEDEDEDDED